MNRSVNAISAPSSLKTNVRYSMLAMLFVVTTMNYVTGQPFRCLLRRWPKIFT